MEASAQKHCCMYKCYLKICANPGMICTHTLTYKKESLFPKDDVYLLRLLFFQTLLIVPKANCLRTSRCHPILSLDDRT